VVGVDEIIRCVGEKGVSCGHQSIALPDQKAR
jgi:hypothetical protein